MTREEFTVVAVVDGSEIPICVYDDIEYLYLSDNDYHRKHGGTEESKQDFVVRVFGGKVNTLDDLVAKLTAESIKENRWALRGNPSATESKLVEMDKVIAYHCRQLVTM